MIDCFAVNSQTLPLQSDVQQDIEKFLARIRENGTRLAYRTALRKFVEYKIILDENALMSFDAKLSAQKFADKTISLYTAALRRFIRHLIANEKTHIDLTRADAKLIENRGLRSGKRYIPRSAPYELPKVVIVFDELDLPSGNTPQDKIKRLEILRNRALAHCLYSSAGRISEILSLTRKQIQDGERSETEIIGKGQKKRVMFFTQESQAAIRSYCHERTDKFPALFISHKHKSGNGLSRRQAWKIVSDAGKKIGVKVSPHLFRHYRATQLLNEGMPLESVQAYLGHASPETTRIVYAHSKTNVLRDQLDTYGLSPKDAGKEQT